MDATDRICAEFDRLLALGGHKVIQDRSFAEQVVYYTVVARCEKDMNSFAGIFEQAMSPAQVVTLIQGLRCMGKRQLAKWFQQGLDLLQADDGSDWDWDKFTETTMEKIETIGDSIGDQLWDLNEKLVVLLNEKHST